MGRWEEDWEFLDGRAVVEEVLRADIGDGTVYIYRIEPDEYHSGDADFTDFYIATYKTSGHLGKYGVGVKLLGKHSKMRKRSGVRKK